MNSDSTSLDPQKLADLERALSDIGPVTVAVSGGVDSMTLASFAHRRLGTDQTRMVHAVSPAVPAAATARVKELAEAEGWHLSVVDAGEYGDERYRQNPINRCYFCKSNLYETLGGFTHGTTVSGTNTDDLGDFRPGLKAASENTVRHPYVEAGFAKAHVRALARYLGLPAIAELPASPCLASRVETGLRIEKSDLHLIDRVETWLASELDAQSIRCRKRAEGFVIEIDREAYSILAPETRTGLAERLSQQFSDIDGQLIRIEPYKMGSAFVGDRSPEKVPS